MSGRLIRESGCGRLLAALCLLPLLSPGLGSHQAVNADTLDKALSIQADTEQGSMESQTRVEQLDDEARAALEAYRHANKEFEALKVYDDQLEKLIRSQDRQRASLEHQLEDIEVTQRSIVPLMERMLDVLEQFVELDKPFLQQERLLRLQSLRALKDRSDVSLAEKFRRLMEAYRIEMDYGRTVEAYQARIDIDGVAQTLDLLRFGRVGLYYLSLDEQQAGMWDHAGQRWVALPDRYRSILSEALSVARKQTPPRLLALPVTLDGDTP